jgi:hyperosmotically inducible periplasmic protein
MIQPALMIKPAISRLPRFAALLLAATLVMTPPGAFSQEATRLERQVRHELVMLPFYSLFDNFEFRVDGNKVTLMGQVTRPTLKTQAERVVSRLEEVRSVDNQIEVLPVSPNDDRIRQGVYRAIYYHPTFTRYSVQAVPPIHIIVKNGDVTLTGSVATKMEKEVANMQANGVPGVFSVTNNLVVDSR